MKLIILLELLMVFLVANSYERRITSLEAPPNCNWFKQDSLKCRLRTLRNVVQVIGNLSSIQADSIQSLSLQCNDGLIYESQIEDTREILQTLINLKSIEIDNCKFKSIPDGVFTSGIRLKSLSLKTQNNEWSGMSLEINRDSLRGLSALDHLDLSNNNIWTLPSDVLCPVPNLISLNLTRNKLQEVVPLGFTDWSVTCSPNLQSLDLSANDLSALPDNAFNGLKTLNKLLLQDNQIRHVGDLALAGLTRVTNLNMSTNRLVALPPDMFRDNEQLLELILSNNSLTLLAPALLDPLVNLKILDLSNNELTSYWINRDTFAKLTSLVSLDLSFNSLTKIDSYIFKNLGNLQILKLEHNKIEILSDGCFSSLTNLYSLTLAHNLITRFDSSQTAGLQSINQLFLDGNRLTYLHRNALDHISTLQDFSLSGNLFTQVPEAISQLKGLKTLDLGNNKISKIKNISFVGLNELYGLRLVDNKLENISRDTFSNLPGLQVLNLASNVIRHVESNSFNNNLILRAVRLDNNLLTEIRDVFTTLSTLVWLNISDNKLLWFDYSYLPPNIEWLDMHNNQINELGNYYMVQSHLKIKMLDASYNFITDISESSIPNSIETLFLNNNNIKNIASSTFLGKKNIKKVVLYDNLIRHLDANALAIEEVSPDESLPEFYIGSNPILCDCTMEWLPKINELAKLRKHPRVMDLDAVTCEMVHKRATPHRPLLTLKPADFLCNYDTHCFALCHCCDFDACDCEMTCPDNCSCYHDHSWSSNVVDCSNGGYKTVPEKMPMDATEIYLDGNDLGDLGSHMFIGKRRLEVLFLNNSRISALHNRTFNGTPSLRVLHLEGNGLRELRGFEFDQLENLSELYLDHNAIAKVGNTTFNKMTSLQVLRLDSNRIVDFRPWEALAGKDAVIALEGNAWNCDCANTAKMRAWLAEHQGDPVRMYCQDGTETLAQALRRCEDPTSREAVRRGINDSPAVGGSFVPLLAGALVTIILVCLIIALIFAFRRDVCLWLHSKYGLRLGNVRPPVDEERDRLYDGYIIYNERDQDFVSGCLSAELEQSGLTLCLHYRDLVPARPQEALPSAAAAACRIVLVFSPVFLTNEWQQPEFRAALRCALENIRPSCRKRRVVILLAAEICRSDPELQFLLQTCEVIVWGDKRFWEKLKFIMPDPKRRLFTKNQQGHQIKPARYSSAPLTPAELWTKPSNTMVVAPVHHAPTPTPTQSTYVSSASSRTEDDDSEHHNHGYSALNSNPRPPSLASRNSHLYSTIPEPPPLSHQHAISPNNPRTYFV